ncbi:MAG: hypothetical protein AAB476_01000, partial [Patescibacteria group bacterium]
MPKSAVKALSQLPDAVVVFQMVAVPVTQFAPSKYWPLAQAAAREHLAGSGMPKSILVETPALGIQILEPDGALIQADFN